MAEPDLAACLRSDGKARGSTGIGLVYPDVAILEATRVALEAQLVLTIPADNRRLVELTTHPEALDRLVAERGGLWPQHRTSMRGIEAAHRRVGGDQTYDRRTPFGDQPFPDDSVLGTRLGERDRTVQLLGAPTGPFEHRVSALRIPHWMAPSGEMPEAVEAQAHGEGALSFALGDRSYVYDRLGLRLDDGEPVEADE